MGTTRWGKLVAVAAVVLLALACAAAAVVAPARGAGASRIPAGRRCAGTNARPGPANERTVANAVLCLVNRVRAAHGLAALHTSGTLGRIAGTTVLGMVREDYFADVGPSGRTPMSLAASAGYGSPAAVGQNIAWGTGANAAPAHIVAAWLASPAHREVLLDGAYRDAGAADVAAVPTVVGGRAHGATYAIELGAR